MALAVLVCYVTLSQGQQNVFCKLRLHNCLLTGYSLDLVVLSTSRNQSPIWNVTALALLHCFSILCQCVKKKSLSIPLLCSPFGVSNKKKKMVYLIFSFVPKLVIEI